MKINELKINDSIEYNSILGIKRKGIIGDTNTGNDNKHFLVNVISNVNTIEYVPYDKVISKLEPMYKEIPIEHPIVFKPVSFDIMLTSVSHNIPSTEEPFFYTGLYYFDIVHSPNTLISGYGEKGFVEMKYYGLLPFNTTKKYKITIEEII